MATFYIQLQDKLLQISGELTAENISRALGYVPVSPNVTNELSQRVDNIAFDSLKDNPFLQDGSGELNIVDEAGNIIAKIDADGIHSVDFIAGEHRLSDKTDKTYVDEAVKNVKVDLTGYATEEYVNNIDFYNINNNPIVDGEENSLTIVDENSNIGLKINEDGLYVKDVIADGHILSQKANASDIPSLDGLVKTEDLPNFDEFAKTSDIPSLDEYAKTEDLPNFDEFAKTEDIPSLDGYAKTSDIPSLDGYATEEWVNNKNYATEYDLKTIDYSSINNVPVSEDGTGELNIIDESGNIGMKVASEAVYAKDFVAGEHKLSEKVDKTYVDNSIAELVDDAPETLDTLNELAAALNDNADIVDVLNQSIGNKQDTITDLETIRQGAAKGATALQSYTEQYKGTVTGVKINETTKNPSNGIVDLGTIITSHQDISGKQDKLVSGTNIKTINGQSLLGSGDITISGGASSEDKIVTLNGDPNLTIADMEPEKIYIVGVTLQTLTIESFADNGSKHQQYDIVFKMGAYSTPSLTLPDNVLWANGVIPEIKSETPYELSITCSKHGISWNIIVYKAVLTPFKSVE